MLGFHALQRTEKIEDFSEQDVGGEVADVIITTLLLAETIDIDVESALENKIEAVEKRYE